MDHFYDQKLYILKLRSDFQVTYIYHFRVTDSVAILDSVLHHVKSL